MTESPSGALQARVLDAGCGMQTAAGLPTAAYVVGIDISQAALDRHHGLDERIVGDIERYPFESGEFDLVVCHDVLEHLDDPVAALRNLARAVKPGGEIDIQMPILWSAKGLLTKLTPHGFHVWVYRRLFHFEHAGEEGYGPFPTTLRITPKKLEGELSAAGFEVVRVETWRAQPSLPSPLSFVWGAVGHVEKVVFSHRGATEYRGRFRRLGVAP
jgi:SAM-dependent methyltransferase